MKHTFSSNDISLAWAERQSRKDVLFNDKGHYWDPESLPFARALAVIQIVLLYGKADKPYMEAKEAWRLPDCKQARGDFEIAFTETGLNALPNMDLKYAASHDFQQLIAATNEFIKTGFNRQEERDNETWKVLPSAEAPLFRAVALYSLGDYLGVLPEWNRYKKCMRNGEPRDTEVIMDNRNDRTHRKLVKVFKKFGRLVNDGTLLSLADEWYKARVSFNSLVEAASDLHLASEDLSKRIAPIDDAVGWPRHK